eukprot:TRINITY_DN66218_c0_g1_i1.p2 TRINITY_DN66218_c0_g1~~TRINITY_DN66218_c0_g1_i1.p2  ORF type:complete len:292 (+),score=57.62 TRINITY_DN66218_c0_g1_i1:117-992(+)
MGTCAQRPPRWPMGDEGDAGKVLGPPPQPPQRRGSRSAAAAARRRGAPPSERGPEPAALCTPPPLPLRVCPSKPESEATTLSDSEPPPSRPQQPPVPERRTPRLVCDRCDGSHLTASCPIFRKERENHPDARRRRPPSAMGRPCGARVVTAATVHRQPADGSCLFHALAFGIPGATAASLRRELADWTETHADAEIAEDPLRDWLWWDQRQTPGQYAARMRRGAWGGGVELAACCRLKGVDVHVWEPARQGGGFRRISCFDCPGKPSGRQRRRRVNVLYRGGVHYDALELH